MNIKETLERECCHPNKDLLLYRGVNSNKLQFCKHCGQLWRWDRENDPAGGTTSVRVKVQPGKYLSS